MDKFSKQMDYLAKFKMPKIQFINEAGDVMSGTSSWIYFSNTKENIDNQIVEPYVKAALKYFSSYEWCMGFKMKDAIPDSKNKNESIIEEKVNVKLSKAKEELKNMLSGPLRVFKPQETDEEDLEASTKLSKQELAIKNKSVGIYVTSNVSGTNSRTTRLAIVKTILDSLKEKPIEIDDYYIGSADKEFLKTHSEYNATGLTISNKGSMNGSCFGFCVYRKTGKVFTQVCIIRFIIEEDKHYASSSSNSKNANKTMIVNAKALLEPIFGGSEWILRKNNCKEFINKMEEVLTEKNVPEIEKEVWIKMFDISSYIKKGVFDPSVYFGKEFKISKSEITVGQYINSSNINVVAAELIIPYLLVSGVKIIGDCNIIKSICNGKEDTVQYVRWPKDSNNKFTDYGISFVKTKNDEREKKISAKANGTGNSSTIITILLDEVTKENIDKNAYQYKNNKNLCGSILKTLDIAKHSNIKITAALACWLIGSTCNKKKELTENEISELNLMFTYLKNSKKFVDQKIFWKLYEKTLSKFGITKKDFSGKLTPGKKCFPYSLSWCFEKIAVDALNNNKEALADIYRIKFGMESYYQIYLDKSSSKGFKVSVFVPDDVISQDKSKNNTYASKIKLKDKSSRGNDSKIFDDRSNINVFIQLMSRGGIGQFIGIDIVK